MLTNAIPCILKKGRGVNIRVIRSRYPIGVFSFALFGCRNLALNLVTVFGVGRR